MLDTEQGVCMGGSQGPDLVPCVGGLPPGLLSVQLGLGWQVGTGRGWRVRRKGREREARTESVFSQLLLPLLILATVSDDPETLMSIFSNSHCDLQGWHD